MVVICSNRTKNGRGGSGRGAERTGNLQEEGEEEQWLLKGKGMEAF